MSLTNEQILALIDMYRDRKLLWDSSDVNHKNKFKRHDMIMEIAVSFAIEKNEVEKKIRNLQSTFAKERKKIMDSRKTGSGSEDIYVSKWFAYDSMMFLVDKNKPRPTVDTEKRNEENEEDIDVGKEQEGEAEDDQEGEKEDEGEMEQEGEEERERGKERNGGKEREGEKRRKEFRSPLRVSGKRKTNSMPVMDEALNLMKTISQRKEEHKDEYTLFGQTVALKLRKISSPQARFTVQNIINQALFDGEMGIYSTPPPHFAPQAYGRTPSPSTSLYSPNTISPTHQAPYYHNIHNSTPSPSHSPTISPTHQAPYYQRSSPSPNHSRYSPAQSPVHHNASQDKVIEIDELLSL